MYKVAKDILCDVYSGGLPESYPQVMKQNQLI